MHKTKWMYTKMNYDFSPLAARMGISPFLAEILVKRGFRTEKEMTDYLHPDRKSLHSPWLMKDMEKACEIILEAGREGRKIRIIGDYDVDGVMATAVLMKGLERLGVVADCVIPDRVKDGYGIRDYMAEQAKEQGASVILTCDNGISAMDAIVRAKELGMKVVLTDHHDVPFSGEDDGKIYHVPPADAVLNPKQQDCGYPCKVLCGAAVAYKLIAALYERAGRKIDDEKDLFLFVAIATVCDVMPLVEENRIFVKHGLDMIHETGNYGLNALLREKGLAEKKVTAYHLGFVIGPCINAAGRIDTAGVSLSMFLSSSEEEAGKLAGELAALNESRREMTEQAKADAIKMIEGAGMENDKVLFIYLPDCHESIAGIVAGRIREQYYRPTYVAVRTEKGVKGSGRSIPEYSMYEELTGCRDLLTEFGGHPLAAGFSLPEAYVLEFRRRLNLLTTLSEEELVEKLRFDLQLPLRDCDLSFVEEMEVLEPFGQNNKKPLFAATGLRIFRAGIVGKNQNVLRLTVSEEGSEGSFQVVGFDGGSALEAVLEEKYGAGSFDRLLSGEARYDIDMLYQPDINEYNGARTVQFVAKGYR